MSTTERQKMDSFYLALDHILGHIPKPLLVVVQVVGAVCSIFAKPVFAFIGLSDVDYIVRFVIAGVTLAVGYYTIKSHRSNIAANERKKVLDQLSEKKLRRELGENV